MVHKFFAPHHGASICDSHAGVIKRKINVAETEKGSTVQNAEEITNIIKILKEYLEIQ